MSEWLGYPSKNTAMVFSLNKTNSTQADKRNDNHRQFTVQETKGCFDIRRNSVTIQVERNKTRCLGQNCVVVANITRIITTRFNICWEVTKKLRPLVFALGVIATLSNGIVFGIVIRVKSLRKCPPFLLVSHMSFCDILVGIYSFGIAFGHGQTSQEFSAWNEIYCPGFRSIFIFAEVVGSLTSLLMTGERYLAIVYCMKPDARLGRKAIVAAFALFWIAGATSATLVQLLDTRSNQTAGQMCLITRNSYKISSVFVSELILLFLVLVYVIVVALYFHIFIVVRRSSRNVGVLRESKLAKRICAIVLSSFVFFAVPNSTLAWFIFQGGGVFEDARLNRTLLWWLPPVCLVANACLNPCLFAFRNDKFVRALRKIAKRPFRRLLGRKQPAKRDPFRVFGSVETLATSRSDFAQGIELTMFSAAEYSQA